ncbi:MAG: phosphotriesterase [Actinobacteria bacterium]|nr:phosphotriesterase [Actinomycetota bacterium]
MTQDQVERRDTIYTVLGPIEPSELGRTSMHEHLLIDGRVWLTPAQEEEPADRRVVMENLGFVRWNLVSLEDNLILDDVEACIRELTVVKALGGSGIVDLTNIGIGRRVEQLPEIARRTGLHVMVGCGFYIHPSHPEWVEEASTEELAELLLSELRDGIDGTGIRPALIGEIGTSDPVTAREEKVLRAAGRAGAATGAAVNVHLDPRGAHALHVLDLLTAEGMRPDRVVFSHMDEHLDRDYHAAVADAGAVLEYDTFGSDFYFGELFKDPTDLERFDYVMFLLERGVEDQLVLGCDVWVKAAMKTFGGMGYEHLLKRIVPSLVDKYGVSEETVDRMLVRTPRRLLARPAVDD